MTNQAQPQSSMILYQTEDGRTRIQCRFENETVWLTQAVMADLFQKDIRTINEHVMNIFEEGELNRETTIRKFRIVRLEDHYCALANDRPRLVDADFEHAARQLQKITKPKGT